MKRGIAIIVLALIFGLNVGFAQENKSSEQQQTPEKQKPNSEEIAKRRTDRMRDQLSLTEEQYQKVYKLNIKEAKAMDERHASMPRPNMQGNRPPRGMGGGSMPMGRGGRSQRHMGGNDNLGEMPKQEKPQMKNNDNDEEREKQRAKYNDKLDKILSEEQIKTWNELEKQRRIQEFENVELNKVSS